jgi:hypothetical protein
MKLSLYLNNHRVATGRALNPWTLGPLSSTKSLGDDPYV